MPLDELVTLVKSHPDATTGNGASASDIRNAEKQLRVVFPELLAEYLRRLGWVTVSHKDVFGLGADVPSQLSLIENTVWEREQSGCPLPRALIPIYNDGAGNLVCIDTDTASSRYGRMLFWDHENGPEQTPDEIASGLDAWLHEEISAADDGEYDADLRRFFAGLVPGAPNVCADR